MYIAASGSENLFPLDVINKGQVFQTGNGNLTLGGAARFVNDAGSTYWIQNDLGMDRTSDLATVAFLNQGGSVIKASGPGTSVFQLPVTENTGKFETWTGTIDLAAGVSSTSGTFFADGLGTNASQFGIIFGGASTFTGIVTTETGSMLLRDRSQIRVTPTAGVTGSVAGEWRQKADFLVNSLLSRVEIEPGATLHNTGSLVTANGGALVAVGAVPGAPGSPSRGLLLNDGSFQGVVLGLDELATGPCIRGEAAAFPYCVMDVRNTWGAEFIFQPSPEIDRNDSALDGLSETNAVGIFENAGRVRIPGVVDPANGIATVVAADEFIQDQQGTPTLGQTPELVIDPDGELRVGTFTQLDGDTVVNGLLRGEVVQFLAGTVGGSGIIEYTGSLTGAVIFGAGLTVQGGNSPGILTINGNLEAAGAIFDIEVAGTDPGTLFDQLVVNGDANLTDATVNFRFIDGFLPTPGDTFDWLVVSGFATGLDTLTVSFFSDLGTVEGFLDGNGRLFVDTVTPIPLPPAAWALGSALLALGGAARRRSATVSAA
jgi:hypothetical protein